MGLVFLYRGAWQVNLLFWGKFKIIPSIVCTLPNLLGISISTYMYSKPHMCMHCAKIISLFCGF